MEDLDFTAAEAQRFYDAGNRAVADVLCRGALAKNPRDQSAATLLAKVAEGFGETAAASRILASAGIPAPAAPTALPASWGGVFAPEQKFLLIKAWGNGFFSDLDYTLGLLLLAEMTGRTPVIHWGRNSLFSVDREQDAWREYFEPVSPLSIDDLTGKGYDIWPPKWNEGNLRVENLNKLDGPYSRLSGLHALNRPERIVVADFFTGVPTLTPWLRPDHPLFGRSSTEAYRYLIAKYLRVRTDLRASIDRFANERMAPSPTAPLIAAHIRASDKLKEDPQLDQKIAVYPGLIEQFASRAPGSRVFLMTDSSKIRDDYAARYGARLITTECTRTQTQVGLHYQKHDDRRKLGVEVLTDAFLAARCDYFVGLGSSNVTCFIYHLKPWSHHNCVLIGPLMTHMMNPFLYMTHEQLDRFLPAETMQSLRRKAEEPPLL